MPELKRKAEGKVENTVVDTLAPVEHENGEIAPAPTKRQEMPKEPVEPAAPVSTMAVVRPAVSSAAKDPLTEAVEGILEEDLGEVFSHMNPAEQQAFKQKGEEVAGRLRAMIEGTKVSLRKVLGLIRSWLRMIPGVNKFFLEQEAKIKTDKIHELARHHNIR